MPNPFDQFDSASSNPFDQFDEGTPKEKAGFGTAIKSSFAGVGNMADTALSTLAGSAAALFGDDKSAIDIDEQRKQRALQRNQWANLENQEIGLGGKIAGTLATLPMQIAGAGFSPAETADTLKAAGESNATALQGAGIDAAGNIVGMVLPGFKQGSLLTRSLTGGAVNAAQEAATKKAIQSITETEEGGKRFAPTMEDTLIAGLVGAGGAAAGKGFPKKSKQQSPAKAMVEDLKSDKTPVDPNMEFYRQEAARKQQEAQQAQSPITVDREGVSRTPEQERSQPQTPADYTPNEGFDGQRNLFDYSEEGRMPNPYEAVTGDWRVDENGMPIKADLSMDVANAEAPLQRNLWGDELPQKHPQENDYNLPQAFDRIPNTPFKGDARDIALSRLQGEIKPSGELLAAKMRADIEAATGDSITPAKGFNAKMRKQGGGVLVGENRIKPEIRKTEDGFEAYVNGQRVGYLRSNLTGEQSKALGENANVDIVKVQDDVKGKGVGSALYQAWAKEHGNNIAPSGKTSKESWSLWKNKYPEKVDAFVKQEAQRIREGAPVDQVLSNITDPTIAQRVMDSSSKIPFNFKKQGGGVKLGWGDKKKLQGFSNVPGIKETLRDIGDARIETPEEAVSLAQTHGDVSQNVVQRSLNQLTKGGTYLKSKVDNPVVHYVVDRFIKADSLARGEINQKLHGEYLNTLRSLSKEEYHDAFELLNAADLTKKTITPEMMQQYGLSTSLQDFITTHQTLMNDVVGKINTAREAAGKQPITAREAYSAMNMSGDYRKVAYKTVNGVREVVGVIGADRKAGKLGWTLEKIENQMKAKDPTLEFGPLQDTTARRGSSKGTPHEAFQDALEVLGEDNPNIADFLNVMREVAKDDPANYMGMQKHTMQKKGVWGMEGRKPWMSDKDNATQFFENQVRYMESAYNWSHLSEAARDSNKVLSDETVATKQPNAVKMSESYIQNALGLNPSRFGRAVDDAFNALGDATGIGPFNLKAGAKLGKAAANTMMLSLNPSFLAIQLIQGPAALPAMTALLRGRGLAPSSTALSGGLGHFAEAGITLLKHMTNPESLKAIDKGAVDYARKHHIYATDMVEHTNQTQKDAGYWATKVTQSPAAVIESGTRAQVYMTFVKMMNESGLTPKDGLYEQAHRMTDQSMNNYSALEKPPIYNALGPLGSMAYNLKSFAHNEISRWAMLAREIPATGNATPLLTQMATTIALAGVMGLPFYSQWEELYDFITKKLGSPRSLTLDVMDMSDNLSKHLGDKADMFKYAMSHGMASVGGANISKRVGLSDVFPSQASDAAFAGGGKLVDMASTAVNAAMKPDEAHAKAAALAWAPPVVSSALKEKWYTDDKFAYTMDPGKPRQVSAELTARDKLLKKIGISGINESTQKEKQYQLGKLDKTYQDYRDSAMVAITFDLAQGKPLSEKAVEKYFVQGQGDVSAFEAQINSAIQKLNMTPNQLVTLQDSASKSVTRAMSLQRRMDAQ